MRIDGILVIDWPLAITAVLFLILSGLYGWGLLRFFRYNFYWHRASVFGILTVVCCTGTLVWYSRYGSLAWELVWSLFIVFSAALPGMVWAGLVLYNDSKRDREEIDRLRKKVLQQCELMHSIETIVRREGQKSVEEIIKVLDMRDQAKEMLKSHVNNLN